MALLGTALTMADWAKRIDENGKVAKIVEMLSQTNEILDDMLFIEGNLPTGHKTTIRTGLPEATWRLLNYGVKQSKSTTAQIVDTCGMLEAYSKVDKALADLNGNKAEFRLSEDRAYIEGMNQQMARTILYGNQASDPATFTGLAPRYNSMSAANKENIILGGGTGLTNTSIWVVTWGENTAHGIFPKGSSAGLSHRDLGEVTLTDADGGEYQGYRTHYKWDLGLTVRDWRYVSRIANIDVNSITKDASAGADLIDLLTDATERIPNLSMGRTAIYCNRKMSSFLRKQVRNAKNVQLSIDEFAGKKILHFDGIPIRRVDAILNTESTVS